MIYDGAIDDYAALKIYLSKVDEFIEYLRSTYERV